MLLNHWSPDSSVNEPDSDVMTALMHAVQGGFEDVVLALLEEGANVDDADKRKRTALHWAALKRREALLRRLLERSVAASVDLDVYDARGRTHHCIAPSTSALRPVCRCCWSLMPVQAAEHRSRDEG